LDAVTAVTEGWTRREATADCGSTTGTADVTDGCCAISCNPDLGWIAVGTGCDGLPTTLITLLPETLVVTGIAETGCNHMTYQHNKQSSQLTFFCDTYNIRKYLRSLVIS